MNMQYTLPKPPWKGVGRYLESRVRKALYDFNLLEDATKVAVALSGGKDSLILLTMLNAISGRGFPKIELFAIHVNGAFSCGAGVSLDYLKEVCCSIDVPLIVRESTQELKTLECYPCARERRSLLFEAAKSVGAKTIAFGHHRDDSVQTLLMNLLQKGEFCANLPKVPMHRYGVTIIRPLIYVEEATIKTFSQQEGFHRISCRCPVGQHSMRKKVEEMLEDMQRHFPHARNNLALAAHLYGSDKAAREL